MGLYGDILADDCISLGSFFHPDGSQAEVAVLLVEDKAWLDGALLVFKRARHQGCQDVGMGISHDHEPGAGDHELVKSGVKFTISNAERKWNISVKRLICMRLRVKR